MASIFYKPCCEILRASDRPLSANALMKKIIIDYPEIQWSKTQGPVRAMLMSASRKNGTGIKIIEGTTPPEFVFDAASFIEIDESDSVLISNDIQEAVEATPEEIMENAFRKATETLKGELLEKIYNLNDTSFETLANQLIAAMGFGRAENTPVSHDGGIDGYIYADHLGLRVIGVQAKHYAQDRKVQRQEIDSFIGALSGKDGVFVTSADFSSGAKTKVDTHNCGSGSKIALINSNQLVEYMIKFNVGVQETSNQYILKQIDKDFFENL